MSAMDELQALTTSIGEYTVDTLGKDQILGLRVTMDRRNLTGHITIVLSDSSGGSQKQALRKMFDVEQVFFEDAVLSYAFAKSIDSDGVERPSVPAYSYA